METVLKTVVPAMVPWVRIPPLPPTKVKKLLTMYRYSDKELRQIAFKGGLISIVFEAVFVAFIFGLMNIRLGGVPLSEGMGGFVLFPFIILGGILMLIAAFKLTYDYFNKRHIKQPLLTAAVAILGTYFFYIGGLIALLFIVKQDDQEYLQ